jgi:hypothetical protein
MGKTKEYFEKAAQRDQDEKAIMKAEFPTGLTYELYGQIVGLALMAVGMIPNTLMATDSEPLLAAGACAVGAGVALFYSGMSIRWMYMRHRRAAA